MSTSQYLPLRLNPGQDLKQEIQRFCLSNGIKAGAVIAAVGSLSVARLRLASGISIEEFTGPFEILSLSGTLSLEGLHLHISLADKKGHCIGGHLVDGCVIYTTAELILLTLPNLEFKRSLDPQTGYRELDIRISK